MDYFYCYDRSRGRVQCAKQCSKCAASSQMAKETNLGKASDLVIDDPTINHTMLVDPPRAMKQLFIMGAAWQLGNLNKDHLFGRSEVIAILCAFEKEMGFSNWPIAKDWFEKNFPLQGGIS